jgi:hypothetical protein
MKHDSEILINKFKSDFDKIKSINTAINEIRSKNIIIESDSVIEKSVINTEYDNEDIRFKTNEDKISPKNEK